MTASKRLRVAIYTRVSGHSQKVRQAVRDEDRDRWTLPAQRRALEDECKRHGWEIVAEHCDAGISGETLEARPEMLKLLAATREGRFDVVLAVEWERFSRSRHGRDWGTILGASEEGGAKLAVPGQVLDPTSPEDSFLGGLFGLLAAREKAKMIARTSRGIRERVRSGRWWGSLRPFGYVVGADGKLVPHDVEAAVVRRVFAETRAGATLCDVAAGLNRDRVPTHKGGREWFPSAIRRVLGNEVYAGTLVYGRTRTNPRGGAPLRVENAHPAIVPPHEFFATADLVTARKRAGCPPSRWDQGWILTALLLCPTPGCGRRLHGGSSGGTRGPSVRYYGHGRSRMPGAPKCAKLRADPIERAVLERIVAALAAPQVVEAVRRRAIEERLREGTDEAATRASLEDEMVRLRRRVELMYDDRIAGRLSADQWASWNSDALEQEHQLRNKVRAIEDRVLALSRHADVEQVLARLSDLGAAVAVMTPRERKQLVFEIVREVRVESREPLRVEVAFRLPGLGEPARAARREAAS